MRFTQLLLTLVPFVVVIYAAPIQNQEAGINLGIQGSINLPLVNEPRPVYREREAAVAPLPVNTDSHNLNGDSVIVVVDTGKN
ncbi:hypothetical protein G6F56_011422 [Rhizopus delemar]|nr:hypothetical protein G6F56_011422 [Rhizopus delemar]